MKSKITNIGKVTSKGALWTLIKPNLRTGHLPSRLGSYQIQILTILQQL